MVQLTVINFNHGMNRQRVIPAGIWNRNCLTREEYSKKMRTDQPIKAASARIFLLRNSLCDDAADRTSAEFRIANLCDSLEEYFNS